MIAAPVVTLDTVVNWGWLTSKEKKRFVLKGGERMEWYGRRKHDFFFQQLPGLDDLDTMKPPTKPFSFGALIKCVDVYDFPLDPLLFPNMQEVVFTKTVPKLLSVHDKPTLSRSSGGKTVNLQSFADLPSMRSYSDPDSYREAAKTGNVKRLSQLRQDGCIVPMGGVLDLAFRHDSLDGILVLW